jgi:hypothetical protein
MSSTLCKVALTLLVLFVLDAGSLVAKTVTGTVTSATDNEPLIGVTVKVSDGKSGAVTDFNGKYCSNVETVQSLVFTYVGYDSKSIKVGAQNVTCE